jgi:hypothetical protein
MHSDTSKQNTFTRVCVHYKDANRPLVYEHAYMTYTKDVFFCVQDSEGVEFRHPIANIWRTTEDNPHKIK